MPQAIEIVSKAIEADNAGEYERALSLYRDALGRFTMGLKYEKNEARKKLVLERVEGYMKRAEELRDYVAKQNELEKSGGGGAAMKKAGDKEEDEDAEKKKLRGALAGAIVSEKPNIRWDDVAGLENAKESLKEVSWVIDRPRAHRIVLLSSLIFLSTSCRLSFCQLDSRSYLQESAGRSKEYCCSVRLVRGSPTLPRRSPRKPIRLSSLSVVPT